MLYNLKRFWDNGPTNVHGNVRHRGHTSITVTDRHQGHSVITRTDCERRHTSFTSLPTVFSVAATESACQWWCELQQENCACSAREQWVFKHTHTPKHSRRFHDTARSCDLVPMLQDNVIFERLNEASQYKDLTIAHLEQFATEGMNIFHWSPVFLHLWLHTACLCNPMLVSVHVCVCWQVYGLCALHTWIWRRARIRSGWRSIIVWAQSWKTEHRNWRNATSCWRRYLTSGTCWEKAGGAHGKHGMMLSVSWATPLSSWW